MGDKYHTRALPFDPSISLLPCLLKFSFPSFPLSFQPQSLRMAWRSVLVVWHSGRTSVFGQRTFLVLHSTCSWRVTTYVGKPSAVGQPTRPFGIDKWVVTCNWMLATSVRGGAIWWTLTKERQAWCNLQVKLCERFKTMRSINGTI